MFSILYVDDEPGLLEIGKLFLESAGDFSVTTVLSGKQAIDKLGQQDFDAIISDYQMPEMNGIEFLKHVRKSFGTSPFILFTGRGREEVVIEAINNGVDFYLQKGGEPQAQFAELAHKVRQAVSRKRAETALSDSERRLADIINFLPDATFAIDTKGTVIAWNRAMERMTGVASSQILGKGDYAYAVPFYHERRPLLINLVLENDPAIAEKYPFVKNEGGNLVSEITIPHFNEGRGAALWFTASPLYDRKGEIVGAIESIREITERKKAEVALNESERRFRELADLLPQGIYEASTDGRMTYVNRIALEMSGYAAEDVKTGLNALEVIAPKDRPRAVALFTRMVKTGARGEGSAEYLAVRKDGSLFPVSIYSSPIYRDGRITGVRGVIIDITDRQKVEESLITANREYTNLLDQIQDVYYFSDTGGRLVRASRSMATLLGYDDISECIGKNIAEDFYANPQERNRLIEELSRNGKVTGFEVLLKKKDGSTVLIEASSHLSYNQEGNVIGVEGTFRDITERKKAEKELAESREYLDHIYSAVQTGIVVIDVKTHTILDVNPAAVTMMEATKEEIVGNLCHRFICPAEEGRCPITDLDMTVDNSERVLLTADGRKKSIIKYVSRIRLQGRDCLLETFIDNTPRKRAEEEIRAANEQLAASGEELQAQYNELAASEQRIRESEERYRTVFETTGTAMLIIEEDATISLANAEFSRMSGFSREQIENKKKWMEFVFGEDREGMLAQHRKRRTDPQNALHRYEFRFLTRSGEIRYIDLAIDIMPGTRKSIASLLDITERRKAEEELRAANEHLLASEEELRQQYDELARAEDALRFLKISVDQSADEVFWLDFDGKILYVNDAACRINGYPRDEFLKMTIFDINPDLTPEIWAGSVTDLRERKTQLFTTRHMRKDGNIAEVEIMSVYVRKSDEEYSFAFVRDITNRKRAESELKAAYEQVTAAEEELRQQYDTLAAAEAEISSRRKQLEEVAATVPGVVYQFYARPDGSRGMYFASSRAREILGLEPDLERFFPEFTSRVHPDDRARFIASIDDAIKKKSDWHFEGRLIKESGETIWFEGRSTPVTRGSELVFSGVLLDITSRRNMEAAIRESEEKYRSLVDISPVAVIVHHGGRILYANPEALRLAGTERGEDVIGRELVSFIHPDDQAMAAEDFRLLADEGKTIQLKEERLVRLNGEPFTVEITAMPIWYQGTSAFLAVFRDITKRKQAEAALAESERKYRTVFETAEEGIWIIDAGFRTVSANRKMQELFGYTEEEMRGRPVWDFVPPDEAESMKRELSRRTCGVPGRYERRWVRKDGTEIWCLTSGTPLFSPDGEFLGSFGMFTDTTERKQMEDTLRESEKKYRLLVENIPFGITLIDADHRIVMSNAAQGQMFHTDAGVWPGRYCYREFEKRDTVCEHCPGTKAMATGVCHVVETEGVRDDGTRFNARIHAIPLPDAEGKATRFIEVVEDITERKKAEDALRQNEEKYRALVETTGTGFVILDDSGRVLDANPEYVRMTGYSGLEEIAGRSVTEWTAKYEQERNEEAIRRCLRDGNLRNFEIEYAGRDGTIVPIEVNATVIRLEGSIQILTLCRDISDRRKAQDTLKTSAEDYHTILRTAMDGFCIIALDGSFIDVNDAFCRSLEYTRDEALALSLGDVEVRETAEETSRHIENIVRNGYDRFETRWQQKGDGTIDVEVSVLYTGTHGGRFIAFSRNITEQKRAEAALRESEEKYRTLVESSFDGIAIHQGGMLVYVNRTAAQLLGSDDPGVFIGKPSLDLVAPAFREQIAERMQKSTKTAMELIHEQFLRLDGTPVDVDVTTTPTTWQGRPAAYVTFRDISAQKKTEEALRESEEKYRMLVEKSRDGVFIIQDGRLVFYNRALAGLTGYTAEELDGKILSDLIAPEDRQMVVSRARDRAASRQVPELYEFSLLHKDGISRTRVRVHAGPGTYKSRPASIGMFYDVTLERKREEALRESEEKFRALVETTSDFIWEVDPSGAYTYVSPQVRQILGYEPEELLGKTPFDLMPPDEAERIAAEFNACIRSGIPIVALENRAIKKDGSGVVLETSGVIRAGKDGTFLGYRGIDRDITKRKFAEEALREKTEELDRYFTTSLDLFCIADTGGYFRRLNPEWEKTLGYTLTELEGHRFLDFVHPDDLESTLAALADIEKQQEVLNFTNRYRHRDGTYRWIEWRSIPAGNLIFAAARDITARHDAAERTARLSALKQDLLRTAPLEEKLKRITDAIVDIFGADFARIWITGPGDLCKKGCIHAEVSEGARLCRNRASCLHLMVSSGRYTHTDGSHRRVPFGAYKIGRIATGDIKQFITNDVTHDPRVHDHAWAESLGLVSFSGFRLVSPEGTPVGVLAFFGRQPVMPEIMDDLDDLATTTSQVIQMSMAEQALRESEARLGSILHGSPVLQFVIDRNHRVISWNKALEEYSGIKAADIIGTDEQWRAFYPAKRPVLADLLVNGNTDAITRLYAGKLRKSRYVEGAFEATDFFPHMGSSGTWLSFTAAPIRDVQGTIIGAIETLEDVTERINAEKALRDSEQWTRTILNTAQAGIILVDAVTHQIVDANKKALELIGLDRESVISAICHRFICPAEKGRCPVTDLGQKVSTSEKVLLTAAGVQIPVLKTVVPAFIGGRDVLVESFVDISEQKQAEAAIRETNRKLNLLNSITRHDIRNQLLVAQGYTQLAILNKPDPVVTDFLAKTAGVIETIQHQIEFTREYQELGVQAPAWFAVGTVISSVRPGTVALRNTCNTAVEIFADPMIDKVFYNLFDNAMKHGTRVTAVTVRCEEKENGLFITFADNGSGIPLDEKQKIFEKGYGKNTGLGLFLVREILAITGITIRETGTYGRGAVFEIIVPAGAYRKTGGADPG
jgi:PAS domain S-box-containing protein